MFKNLNLAVGAFLLVMILTSLFNAGFMGTDEYWTGITRFVPAQEKNLHNMMKSDDVKSPTQMMPLIFLSHTALQLGFEKPYEQYRFVQITLGLLSTAVLGLCLFYFLSDSRRIWAFWVFAFYFAGAFALTRPMYESLSAPWIFLSALALKKYFEGLERKWILISVAAVSLAFLLRPQTGVCALGLLGFLLYKKEGKAFLSAAALGLVFFILAGIPDIFLREGFHSSLLGILFYNVKYGASYAQQPWFFYIPLAFLLLWGPFWISKKFPDTFKVLWPEHKIFWAYILLLIALHSFFPQKWERFIIPVLPLMILIVSDWMQKFWQLDFKKRVVVLGALNVLLWIPATVFPAQQNIIDVSLYLNDHPEIKTLHRYKNFPQWITDVFITRSDWQWVETESLPEKLSCEARLVMNGGEYAKHAEILSDFDVEKIFETNVIEKAAYKMNPEKNLRRTPIYLLKMQGC